MNALNPSFRRLAAVSVLSLIMTFTSHPAAQAATITWANTGANFATGTNWVGGVAPVSTDQASLPAAGTRVNPSLPNATTTIDSLVIDNSLGNYNIVRQGTASILNITPTVTHGPSPATRGISVNTGFSQIGTSSAGARIALGANQTWDIDGNLTIFGSSTSAWTGSFRLTKTGAGTLTFDNTGNGSSYGGTIGSVTIQEGTFAGNIGQINLNSTGTGTNAAVVMNGGTTLSFGLALDSPGADQTIKFNGTSGTATLNGVTKTTTGTVARNLNFDIDNGSADIDMTVGGIGQYSGSGTPIVNVVKTGAGTLRLNAANRTYSGTTTLARGQLLVGGDALVSTNSAFGNSATAVAIGGTGTVSTDNLSLLIDGGNFNIARAININNNNSAGTSTLGINTAHDGIFSGQVSLFNHGLQVQAVAGSTVTFDGNIVNGAGTTSNTVLKLGDGTAIFNGANNYGGATTVGAGTLLVNNSIAGGVTVQSGATLGGNGNIGGSVTLQGTSVLSPGESAGILSVGGNVVFSSASTLEMEIGGLTPGVGGHDQLAVTGSVTLDGTIDISAIQNMNFNPSFDDVVVLIDAGSITGQFTNAANGQSFSLGGLNAQLFYLNDQVILTNFQVPEPSTCTLLGLGALGMLRLRRRKQARAEG